MSQLFQKFFEALKASVPVGGLEINDTALRWSLWRKGEWAFTSLRLPPGIMVHGEVKDYNQFLEALRALKNQTGLGKKQLPIIVSLSSLKAYMQIFTLPLLDERRTEEALALNMRMSSPIPFTEAYASSELVHVDEDSGKAEHLGAFINKGMIDEFLKALRETGFLPVAVEPAGLSIARVIRKLGSLEYEKAYIVMNVNGSGMEFIVFRNGNLHFDYSVSWQDLEREGGAVNLEASIIKSLNQVMNFFTSHWSEPIDSILVSSSTMNNEIRAVLAKQFPFPVREMRFDIGDASSEWLPALGAGFRGAVPRRTDGELSLMGIEAKDEYREEQILHFVSFWRAMVPSVLGVLILALLGASLILAGEKRALADKMPIQLAPVLLEELSTLEKEVVSFNAAVGMLTRLQAMFSPAKVSVLQKVRPILEEYGVTLDRLNLKSADSVSLSGSARIHESILSFRDALEKNPSFKNVNLPFTNIQPGPQGFVFSMTFSFTP